ncbi:MAG: DUF167 domain-containing protein, partial [Candidatus Binataceae bacterium]
MLPAWLSLGPGTVTLKVMARPGASRIGLLRVDPRGLVIGIAATPERGKANVELINTVAQMAGVARSAVELVAGASARQKSLRISCSDPIESPTRLNSAGSLSTRTPYQSISSVEWPR